LNCCHLNNKLQATIAFADSMSLSLEMRFTDPAIPLFVEIEGDALEILFVISTSQVQGAPSSTQRNTQAMNTRKREREQSTSETPRLKKPMKAAQSVALERELPNNRSDYNSRASSRAFGSMPPPSAIPYGFSQAVSQQNLNHDVPLSAYQPARNLHHQQKQNDPLFLPSSQMSVADEAALRAIGLEAEDMDADQLVDLLEGEGEEVDFSHMSQAPALMENIQAMHIDNNIEVDGEDLIEEPEFSATQASEDANRVCHTSSILLHRS
jgi:cell cycle checkpoint control protein RAD9A